MSTDLPWQQADSTRPVYNAQRELVSFQQQAARILVAMNLMQEIVESPEPIPTRIRMLALSVYEGVGK